MKLFLALSLLVSMNTFAAELNLTGGESATIQANVKTKVTCNSSTPNGQCAEAVNGLKTLVESCKTSYSASYCIDKYWPTFKADHSSCAMGALSYCIDQCKTSYSASYCADKCSE